MSDAVKAPRRDRLTPDATRRIVLTKRDETAVRAAARFGAISSSQLRRLLGMKVSRGNRVLRRLFDAELFRRHVVTLAGENAWDSQAIYTPGPAASSWIARWEDISLADARRICRGDRTPSYLRHSLSLVDLFLALQSSLPAAPPWTLRDFLVEREARDELVVSAEGNGSQRLCVRPDAVAVLRDPSRDLSVALWLESDFQNVRTHALSVKMRHLRAYLETGAFAQAYPRVGHVHILIVADQDSRLRAISRICRGEGMDSLCLFAQRAGVLSEGLLAPIWRNCSPSGDWSTPVTPMAACLKRNGQIDKE